MRTIFLLAGAAVLLAPACKKARIDSDTRVVEEKNAGVPGEAMTFAVAKLESKAGALTGDVTFAAVPAPEGQGSSLIVTANVKNATPGEHGLHIHEFGDCGGDDFAAAGKHLNPKGMKHAGPTDEDRHFGDLGNLKVDENGAGTFSQTLTIRDEGTAGVEETIIGKSIVLHEGRDDLVTQPSGDSGKPIACGVIMKAEGVAH